MKPKDARVGGDLTFTLSVLMYVMSPFPPFSPVCSIALPSYRRWANCECTRADSSEGTGAGPTVSAQGQAAVKGQARLLWGRADDWGQVNQATTEGRQPEATDLPSHKGGVPHAGGN